MSETIYKFYDLEHLTQEDLNKLALERNTLHQENKQLKEDYETLHNKFINYLDKQDFAKLCKISRPYLDKLLKGMNRQQIYKYCETRNKIKEIGG